MKNLLRISDAIIRPTRDEKSGAEESRFAQGQLQPSGRILEEQQLPSDDAASANAYLEELEQGLGEVYIEEGNAEDVELVDIDCATWSQAPNGLLSVPVEHRQEGHARRGTLGQT